MNVDHIEWRMRSEVKRIKAECRFTKIQTNGRPRIRTLKTDWRQREDEVKIDWKGCKVRLKRGNTFKLD